MLSGKLRKGGDTMIRQVGRNWVADCDGGCGTSIDTGQKSFRQATIYLSRAEGWDNRKLRDGWRNYCSRCAEQADPDLDLAGLGFTKKLIDDE
jgi:hypothetical protein